MSLAHNIVTTNLFISSYRRASFIKYGQKRSSVIEIDRALPLWVVMSFLFDHVTLINLFISSYRDATGATFVHANA